MTFMDKDYLKTKFIYNVVYKFFFLVEHLDSIRNIILEQNMLSIYLWLNLRVKPVNLGQNRSQSLFFYIYIIVARSYIEPDLNSRSDSNVYKMKREK